ncbi:MAG TPA: asparagine synthase (glutamine-hydrolyzing) [Gemmatimonadaceae bacterium]
MSGLAGIARHTPAGVSVETLGRMAAAIQHRGPDGHGFYSGRRVGFAHVRLSLLDMPGGAQPLVNEDERIIVTSDGAIFNHAELRSELEERGHVFRTRSDAEVIVHGYEEWGADLLKRLEGQFAFAVYDRDRETVFVARDRFGICPLFYAQRSGDFYFGSEIKAVLASGEIAPALDPRGLDEVLRLGAARGARTPFSGIACLEPGTYGVWQDGALWLRQYYELDFPESTDEPSDVIEQLDELMLRSVGLRLRADLPLGAYVTSSSESSIVAALAGKASAFPLRSFSMTCNAPEFDDSVAQAAAAESAGSSHTASTVSLEAIAHTLPKVLWHAETPLLDTAPVLMYHLAKLARESGVRAVVTHHGADEVFLGSDVFKETSVRRFCLRQPESLGRLALFSRVNSLLLADDRAIDSRRRLLDAAAPGDPLFSHAPRFASSIIAEYYAPEFKAVTGDVVGELRSSLPTRFFGWSSLNQAAYLEMTTALSPHVLSSQGDRMAMAHGVEVRYPFLDHRLFDFAASLPTRSRLCGLHGKEVLRRWAARILPVTVSTPTAPVTRYPGAGHLMTSERPTWMSAHLTADALRRVGIFSPAAVDALIRRNRAGLAQTVEEGRALIGVLSTQVWHQQFVESALSTNPLLAAHASVLLTDRVSGTDRPSYAFATNADIRS